MGERKDYAYGTSDYLKADELAGKSVRVIISSVEDVEFEKGLKPVLSFQGKKKRLVVNATNFDILCAGISNNTNDWVGHVIMLRGDKTSFRGKLVNSIRVTVLPKQQQPSDDFGDDMDDGVPDFAASHEHRLDCAQCGTWCQWLGHAEARFVCSISEKFGAPPTPIVLRPARG
jgi:hypothetical protein